MLILQAVMASVFATAALSLMVWSTAKYPPVQDVGTFMTGDCSMVHRWDASSHLGLNVASTLFLGAGNYCMQVLVAPSRMEVDKAHKEEFSLDIGIHSFEHAANLT